MKPTDVKNEALDRISEMAKRDSKKIWEEILSEIYNEAREGNGDLEYVIRHSNVHYLRAMEGFIDMLSSKEEVDLMKYYIQNYDGSSRLHATFVFKW